MKKIIINFVTILEDIYNEVIIKIHTYIHNQKYSTKDYINEFLNVIKNSIYWMNVKNDIYYWTYKELLHKYILKI